MRRGTESWRRWAAALAVVGALLFALVLFPDVRVRGLLGTSLLLATVSAAIATPLGALLALLLVKTDIPGRRAGWLLLGGLMLTPLYLHAAAWQAGFGLLGWATQAAAGEGPIDPLLAGLPGAAWVHAMAAVPWVALIVAAALKGVSRDHEDSASLETSPAGVFGHLTLRRAAAGVLLGSLWVAIVCASEMTATDLFGVRTFAEEIYTQASLGVFSGGQSSSDESLSVIGLVAGSLLLASIATLFLMLVASLLVEPNDQETRSAWRWRLGSLQLVGVIVVLVLLLLIAGLPLCNLAYKAGVQVDQTASGWQRSWSPSKLIRMVAAAPWEHRRELWQSLQLGVGVATAATLLGVPVAWRLAQRGADQGWLLLLIAAGLVVPGPVIGVTVIRLVNQPYDSPLAVLAWFYDRTLLAPWLVQMIRMTPLAALVLWPALASVPRELIDAARGEGVGVWSSLWRIALPMRWPAVAAAWVVALAGSFGELAATVLVMPPGPQTVTLRIFSLLHYGVEDRVAALSLFMVIGYLAAGAFAGWVIMARPRQVNDW